MMEARRLAVPKRRMQVLFLPASWSGCVEVKLTMEERLSGVLFSAERCKG